jgi:hypothetical protein
MKTRPAISRLTLIADMEHHMHVGRHMVLPSPLRPRPSPLCSLSAHDTDHQPSRIHRRRNELWPYPPLAAFPPQPRGARRHLAPDRPNRYKCPRLQSQLEALPAHREGRRLRRHGRQLFACHSACGHCTDDLEVVELATPVRDGATLPTSFPLLSSSDSVGQATLDDRYDDLVFKFHGPETPLDTPPVSLAERRAKAEREAQAKATAQTHPPI